MTDRLEHESQPLTPSDPYGDMGGRNSVDLLLRTLHQQLVAVSNQADLKANMMITISSILVSVAATRLDDRDLRASLMTLMVFLFIALAFAILSVLPKFPIPGTGKRRRPDRLDPLFFGHFATIEKSRYLDEMAAVLRDDAALYRAYVSNIHDQGIYLMRAKYRFLAWSYFWFLAGFVVAGIVLIVTLATD